MKVRLEPFAWVACWLAGLLLLAVILPVLLIHIPLFHKEKLDIQTNAAAISRSPAGAERPIRVTVYLNGRHTAATYDLEQYTAGVVAAEMPADFAPEALKAQAVAARTYVIYKMSQGVKATGLTFGINGRTNSGTQNVRNGLQSGDMDLSDTAMVTDTVQDQAFITKQKMKLKWGADYAADWKKISQAVLDTKGSIMVYQGKPVLAAYFSTSNGYTESAEDYWHIPLAYLKSVPSPWDRASPHYRSEMSMPVNELESKLGIAEGIPAADLAARAKVLSQTSGHRVKQIRIGGKIFSGRAVREKLGLPSTDFSLAAAGGDIRIANRGSGHGMGMSQWGAQELALQGRSAEQILTYYYQGVGFKTLDDR